jgi:hypothetical protein
VVVCGAAAAAALQVACTETTHIGCWWR